MRLRGVTIAPPKPVPVKIYRHDEGGNVVEHEFVCGAVLDFTEFEKYCPPPKPPLLTIVATGEKREDRDDAKFKIKEKEHGERRIQFLVLKSLSATPGLEWESVKLEDPDSWKNYETELKSVFTEAEFNKLFMSVFEANSPSEKRRSEALANFTSTAETA